MGTTIWGSSSRGVTMTAKTPMSSAATTIRGVSFEVMKALAILPEMPMLSSLRRLCLDDAAVSCLLERLQ